MDTIGDMSSVGSSAALDVVPGVLKHLGLLKFAGALMYVRGMKNKK